jgi:acetate kinase
MSTRCGDMDPTVVLQIIDQLAMENPESSEKNLIEGVNYILSKQSGLTALSEVGGDIQELQAASAGLDSETGQAAEFAIKYFVYHTVKAIGSLVASLNGLDVLVFTAGIGTNSAVIRTLICNALEYLGVLVDADANYTNSSRISTAESRIVVRVMKTNEEVVIAKYCVDLLL